MKWFKLASLMPQVQGNIIRKMMEDIPLDLIDAHDVVHGIIPFNEDTAIYRYVIDRYHLIEVPDPRPPVPEVY
jgi:hypothetical protein